MYSYREIVASLEKYQFLIGNVRRVMVFTDHDEAEKVYQFLIGNVRRYAEVRSLVAANLQLVSIPHR